MVWYGMVRYGIIITIIAMCWKLLESRNADLFKYFITKLRHSLVLTRCNTLDLRNNATKCYKMQYNSSVERVKHSAVQSFMSFMSCKNQR